MSEPLGSDIFYIRKKVREKMTLLEIYEKSHVFRSAEKGELEVGTASLFVCGILLKEVFFSEIGFFYEEGYTFDEVWFLLCQSHDESVERSSVWKKMCSLRKAQNVNEGKQWGPLQMDFSPFFQYAGDGIRFTNGVRVRSSFYREDQIEDYFCFRNICYDDSGMDHGIACGLLLYENLMHRSLYGGKKVSKREQNLYSYAANTMIGHNLCGLYEREEKVKVNDDPLMFLLLLAEMIEPLQYMKGETDYREALRAIQVSVRHKELFLRMNPQYFDGFKLEKRLERMKKKIDIGCEMSHETSEIYVYM